MSFLTPWSIAIAAAATIPPLVALYFLKLKRERREVPSTFLWKRAVEDLRANAPFQRLRKSLLLLLQLLILCLAALALGRPMMETAERHEDTLILLVDQSASMNVIEKDGRSRLQTAKDQAKLRIENMGDSARAMVIAFCDRAEVVCSFDTDKGALARKIDGIEPTQSTSHLAGAIRLAEAYAQDMIIGSEDGADIPIQTSASPASVYVFTDGNIRDTDNVRVEKLGASDLKVIYVGARGDNVGIIAMEARRNFERSDILEVTATVENFSSEPVHVEVDLYLDGAHADVQQIALDAVGEDRERDRSIGVVAFDESEFGGGGVAEARLRIDDALSADNRAWTVLEKPRRIRVLLVSPDYDPPIPFEYRYIQRALDSMEVVTMSPATYESAKDAVLLEGPRSAFDLVILDRHSTARLPQGNYMFWGALPQIEGVSAGDIIDDQFIFAWDETHPLLRHVFIEGLFVYEWLDLKLPPEAEAIIEGQTSPVMAYLTRGASQYLISAFSLKIEDEFGTVARNTNNWPGRPDFVVFMQNAVNYLSANIAARGQNSVVPGRPISLPVPPDAQTVDVHRPDGETEKAPASGYGAIHYGNTRQVGVYRIAPALPAHDMFAVNLFDHIESGVVPTTDLTLSGQGVQAEAGEVNVNKPAWQYLLLGMLAVLMLEWIVYNRRVFV